MGLHQFRELGRGFAPCLAEFLRSGVEGFSSFGYFAIQARAAFLAIFQL